MTRWDWTWEEPRSERGRGAEPIGASDALDDEVASAETTAARPQPPSQHRQPAQANTQANTQTRGPAPSRSTPVPPEGPQSRPAITPAVRVRRRRAGALLALIALVLLAAAALHDRGTTTAQHTPPTRAAHPVAHLTAAEAHALEHRAEDRAIDSVLAYTPAIVEGGGKGNEVALTFDDGPGPYTERLVATLDALHVHATFFAIGVEERYFSAGTVAELRAGDVVGDHTENHPMLATLSRHDQYEQLQEQVYRLQLLGAPTPRLFRPPFGSYNANTFRELRRLHMLMVLWSTDTGDFARPGTEAIVQRALAGAHPGAIILMHDAGGDRSETIAALPAIVRGLRARGLRPVTVPRLLLDDPPPAGQPIPTNLSGG